MAQKSKRKKRGTKKSRQWKAQLKFELTGLILFTAGILALFHLGLAGDVIQSLFRFLAGEWAVLLTAALLWTAVVFIVKRSAPPLTGKRMSGIYLAVLTILLLTHVQMFENLGETGGYPEDSAIVITFELFMLDPFGSGTVDDLGGGMIGAVLFVFSRFLFDAGGTRVVSIFLFLLSFLLVTGLSLQDVARYGMNKGAPVWSTIRAFFQEKSKEVKEKKQQQSKQTKKQSASVPPSNDNEKKTPDSTSEETPVIYNFAENAYPPSEQKQDGDKVQANREQGDVHTTNEEPNKADAVSVESHEQNQAPLLPDETENENYELPPISILGTSSYNSQEQERNLISSNARTLEETLQSFGVKAKVNEVHLGPAVTKYEVQPDTGVKVSKIVNLADDLALALAASGIRMEAPIPGKAAIGIEVPNTEVAMVTLREVIEAGYLRDDHILSVALGRDISGEPVLAALDKMPHLLVAGATGSGKSVCINGIITSILMKAKPNEVKLMMIDPKMVELNVYNGVPHLLSPVVTEPKKAAQALKKVVAEMERRYDLFSQSGTRNMEGYNEWVKKQNEKTGEHHPELPYIVVVVDELADLMMVASSEVEDAITRLAQMARAAGIHMIIATQRPSVDVITGVIKANIPSRIAFGVSSQTDSRTILDAGGAEKLLGKGDMLFQSVGSNKSTRVQGAFVSDEEVEKVVEAVVAQQKAAYQEEMIPEEQPENQDEVDDELYPDAVELIVHMQSASVSMLQRRFRIGYTRAARLIDEMEMRGIVGPYGGSKPREVLVSAVHDSGEEPSAGERG
ncbi:DNA translocase FtsK [Salibacterium qingdaonense]|uniref:DNA segregation ATPase FtsK/SpoIIIE, S-DNA-T family n=1 Tax=Salibacterium qingdaonense TaxID=266892 RepID=A0A1I4KA52_9BACI|nr:DNA translocase FtsK [Salibacterium qingdaonense]SFL75386.1 DNA segregation ATPase FtsK/SpoIIIE, S-DNA-T family [Salibacterium qingdaonense]